MISKLIDRRKNTIFYILLLIVQMCLPQKCFADIIALKGGHKYEGKIIDVEKNEILFEAFEKANTCVLSISRKDIHKIEIKPFEFPQKYVQIKLAFFNIPVKVKIFDELILDKGYSFFGVVDIETENAVYFSLLLEKGIGIVEFEREVIMGINGAYSLERLLGRLYFKWQYFCYDIRNLIRDKILSFGTSTVGDATLYEWKKKIEMEELGVPIGKRKVFTPKTLKAFLGGYYSLDQKERYDLGVQKGYLILGMELNDVKLILDGQPKINYKDGKEYWTYPEGFAVVFYKNRLIGYNKKCRERILRDVTAYFPEKLIKVQNK